MRGDSGNDDFYSYGGVGNDVMVSATNDAILDFDASTVTRPAPTALVPQCIHKKE